MLDIAQISSPSRVRTTTVTNLQTLYYIPTPDGESEESPKGSTPSTPTGSETTTTTSITISDNNNRLSMSGDDSVLKSSAGLRRGTDEIRRTPESEEIRNMSSGEIRVRMSSTASA